jgi:YVTN family beta-propeller protein
VRVNRNQTLAFVVNSGSDNLAVISLTSLGLIQTLATGKNPVSFALAPNGETAYVVNRGDNTISQIDLFKMVITATYAAGDEPLDAVTSADGRYVFVANSKSKNVSVIDTISPLLSRSIPLPQAPTGITLSPKGDRLYVVHADADSLSIINTSNQLVEKTIATGSRPLHFAFLNPPTILGFSQINGNIGGGTSLQLIGRGFIEGCRVDFGNSPAQVISNGPFALSVTAPAHSFGPVAVSVTNPDGSTTSTATSTIPSPFLFIKLPPYELCVPYVFETNEYRTNLGITSLSERQTNLTISLLYTVGSPLATRSYSIPPGRTEANRKYHQGDV